MVGRLSASLFLFPERALWVSVSFLGGFECACAIVLFVTLSSSDKHEKLQKWADWAHFVNTTTGRRRRNSLRETQTWPPPANIYCCPRRQLIHLTHGRLVVVVFFFVAGAQKRVRSRTWSHRARRQNLELKSAAKFLPAETRAASEATVTSNKRAASDLPLD